MLRPIYDYKLAQSLPGHSDTILCAAISSNGGLLASGANDGKVVVWNLETAAPKHTIEAGSAVLTMLWQNVDDIDILFCGTSHGELLAMRVTSQIVHVTAILLHDGAVNCLSLKDSSKADDFPLLASSTGASVKISHLVEITDGLGGQTKLGPKYSLSTRRFCALDESDSGRYGGDMDTVKDMVTGLHWLSRPTPELLVAYLYHRVVLYELDGLNGSGRIHLKRSFGVSQKIVSLAVTPCSDRFAVMTLATESTAGGVSAAAIEFFIDSGSCRFSYIADASVAVDVLYIHGGCAIICGSTSGKVLLWDTNTGRILKTLDHNGPQIIQIIAAASQPTDTNKFFKIATATSGPTPLIHVWVGVEQKGIEWRN